MAKKKAVSALPEDLKATILIYSESLGVNLSFASIEDAKKSKDATVKAFIAELTA